MQTIHYRLVSSFVGDVGVVWRSEDGVPSLIRVMLPGLGRPAAGIKGYYPDAVEDPDGDPGRFCERIQAALEGTRIDLSPGNVALDRCPAFQRRVLRETVRIPRGRVTSYGELATAIHAPGAARAVGTALARNPFPLLIPCHRVVRAGGVIGGFGGGGEMKKALLRLEGVAVDDRGRIAPSFFR
ncbi:MAG: MGMT family protein [Deltaproteobacteria bacterium]|nr:MGMT family protein [Deltaproteobacteria bacterium]